MVTKVFSAISRGQADLGWLKANFSFSFGNYFDPEKVQFGMLRVLNDDTIDGGTGFRTHPHENMEIITIPLEGELKHKDSMGNEGIIRFGEVQVMSAGTGVKHSELNASKTEKAKTLQLWVFPQLENVTPRYDQKSFDLDGKMNTFVKVVSPHDKYDGDSLWIYQQAFIYLGIFESGKTIEYEVNIPKNGVYLFLIEGEVAVGDRKLNNRDAMEIIDFKAFQIHVNSKSKILLVEVPMD